MAVILAAALMAVPSAAVADDAGVATAPSDLAYAREVIELTNNQRRANGCSDLVEDSRIMLAAQRHSNEMARYNYFNHRGRAGSTGGSRMKTAGYPVRSWAENIAAGYPTPVDVVRGWMASSGHRANILNCQLVHTGVGHAPSSGTYANYITQDFGTA